jgi:four helix bundle protein
MQDYKDLLVWNKAMDLAQAVFELTRQFPKDQQYVLSSQMQRCALSVPSNIAEGRSRHTENEFVYFLNIARGSLAELQTQLALAQRLNFIRKHDEKRFELQTEEIFRMIYGLRGKLAKSPEKAKTSRLKAIS